MLGALAVLEKAEFDLDAGTLLHYRNKTKIEGRFWLPPELVELLREEFGLGQTAVKMRVRRRTD